jgi:hypothetical protein
MLNQTLPIFIKFRCSLCMDRLGVRLRKCIATSDILISCYVQFLITECLTINYKRVHKKPLSSGDCQNCTGLAASAAVQMLMPFSSSFSKLQHHCSVNYVSLLRHSANFCLFNVKACELVFASVVLVKLNCQTPTSSTLFGIICYK